MEISVTELFLGLLDVLSLCAYIACTVNIHLIKSAQRAVHRGFYRTANILDTAGWDAFGSNYSAKYEVNVPLYQSVEQVRHSINSVKDFPWNRLRRRYHEQFVFIARQHAMHVERDNRYCYGKSVRLSVRPSLRLMLCLVWAHRHTFWWYGRGIIRVFRAPAPLQNFKGNLISGGVKCMGWKNLAIITFYLENGTRYAHGYYGSLTGSRR